MAQVTGLEGAFLSLRKTDEPCVFDLVFQGPGGTETVLSNEPSGYLFSAAMQIDGGDVIVCANAIQHRAHETNSTARIIERVSILCTRSHEGSWTPMVPVVTPDGPWAAWLHAQSFGDPSAIPGDDGIDQFPILFARDFSFQFLNTVDTGRPGTDGYYRQNLDLSGGNIARLGTAVRVMSIGEGSVPAPDSDAVWEPTEAEIAEFEAFIDELPDPPDEPMEGGAP
jgi:hypothetical protein